MVIARCAATAGCSFFTFKEVGAGCHLSSSAAQPIRAEGVVGGPLPCQKTGWFVINESLMLCHQKTIWSRLNFFYIQTIFFASSVRDIRPLLWWEVGPQRREIQRLCQHHRVWKNLSGINKGEIWGTMNCLAGLGCNIASHALGPNSKEVVRRFQLLSQSWWRTGSLVRRKMQIVPT